MGISTGQITSALSTQNRTLSPITSQRCQLIQSNCPSSDAGHSHRQLITEKLRHFTSVGSCGTTYWSVTVLHVAPQWSNTLRVRRFDLCQGWESFHLRLLSQFQVSSSCFSFTAANKVFWSILYKALTILRMSRFNKSAGCQSYLSALSLILERNKKEMASMYFKHCVWTCTRCTIWSPQRKISKHTNISSDTKQLQFTFDQYMMMKMSTVFTVQFKVVFTVCLYVCKSLFQVQIENIYICLQIGCRSRLTFLNEHHSYNNIYPYWLSGHPGED